MIRIAVTALKGGVGVSTLASGLSQAAAHEDLDVLLLDHDDQGLLKYHLGMVGMTDKGEMRNNNARIQLRHRREASPEDGGMDVVMIDLPYARQDLGPAVMTTVDAVVLIVPASATGVIQAPAIKAFLNQGENRFLILNQTDNRIPLKKTSAKYLADQFGHRMIAQVRHDESIDEALAGLEPLSRAAPYSAAWSDMREALASLLAHMNDLPVPASRGQ